MKRMGLQCQSEKSLSNQNLPTANDHESCDASNKEQGINSPEETPSHLEGEAAIPQ